MATATKPCATDSMATGKHPAYYQLHSLLMTLRSMARHEDEICSLLDELGHTGKMTSKLKRDLRGVLDGLHVESLGRETDALWMAVDEAA